MEVNWSKIEVIQGRIELLRNVQIGKNEMGKTWLGKKDLGWCAAGE